VDEVAAFAVHAEALGEEDSAFLGFVLGVDLLVLAQLMRPMCEFALLLVGAEPEFDKFLAELGLFLILLYGRFEAVGLGVVSGRGGILGGGGVARGFAGQVVEEGGEGQLEGSSAQHAILFVNYFND
jgi:hypothetical protein